MVIVAGHIVVSPEQRESYLAGCKSVVEQARRAACCLDYAIPATCSIRAESTSSSAGSRGPSSRPSGAAVPATNSPR